MDGSLHFIENGQIVESSPLNCSVLPGPICHVNETDSLIVRTCPYTIESVKYDNLLIKENSKKNLKPTWELTLEEIISDIKVSQKLNEQNSVLVILGERNVFLTSVNGCLLQQISVQDSTPLCMRIYCFSGNGKLPKENIILGDNSGVISIYSCQKKEWSIQTDSNPYAIKVGSFA